MISIRNCVAIVDSAKQHQHREYGLRPQSILCCLLSEAQMNQYDARSVRDRKAASFWKSGVGVALIMVGLIVAFYLLREHWVHVGQTWPYLILLLCPLMHLFMHDGHGHSDSNVQPKNSGK